jgi:spore photoproduct lyase
MLMYCIQKTYHFFKEAEDLLWTPKWQENKTTLRGDSGVVRYNQVVKPFLISKFTQLIKDYMPYCNIRYIF